jgi:hypothetical protein
MRVTAASVAHSTSIGTLVEAAGVDLDAGLDDVTQMHRLALHAAERNRLSLEGDVTSVERSPAKGLDPEKLAATPTQPSFLLLNPASDVLMADALRRMSVDVELLIDAPAVNLAKSR